MQNQQMKNKVDQFMREYEKLKNKNASDNSLIAQLRMDKLKLEQQLKKATFEAKEGSSPAAAANSQVNVQQDKEMRRLQLQNQVLETQVRDSNSKISNLENKLSDLLKNQRPTGPVEETSKVKMTQLESSMKKVTQDLFEVKGLLNESKKEVNKLRQEKTALQNQLEKIKKDSEKSKAGLKKGGKAA
jgi:chromosome segregation ATPase